MTVKVYVEGGGDGRELRARCRKGFSSFFETADLIGRMPRVIACGGRQSAYAKFLAALASGNERDFIICWLIVRTPSRRAPGLGFI